MHKDLSSPTWQYLIFLITKIQHDFTLYFSLQRYDITKSLCLSKVRLQLSTLKSYNNGKIQVFFWINGKIQVLMQYKVYNGKIQVFDVVQSLLSSL